MATLLLGFFLLFSLIILAYYLAFFAFANNTPKKPGKLNLPVSVIVCAKNEAENLRNFLPPILDQDYPNFEVIIINDASLDNTLEVIEEFQALDGRVKLVDVQIFRATPGAETASRSCGSGSARLFGPRRIPRKPGPPPPRRPSP